MKKLRSIPNPSKLTPEEQNFIYNTSTDVESKKIAQKNTFKGRMISMSDEFFDTLNEYLEQNPTEGNRSSFIVRIVAEYIQNKNNIIS